jgi:hypothetical protein
MNKEVGTLAEIGAKVGDDVESLYIGHRFTVDELDLKSCKRSDYRIISRATKTPSPVRTVTKQEIVPGVYGKVSVGFDGEGGSLLVDLTTGLGVEDLAAAIETITQIRDAMKDAKQER